MARTGVVAGARSRSRPRAVTGALITLVLASLLPASVLCARPATAEPAFRAFIEGLWPEASAEPYRVSRPTFDQAFAGLVPDLSLPDLILLGRPGTSGPGQAEFVRPPAGYLNPKTLAGLAAQGRALARTHATALARIEAEIGVEGPIALALWGRETAFGTYKLPHDAIRVLATQAYTGRRKELFRTELLYALKILELRLATRAEMRSSWAGAMGLTQFMPSEFFTSLRGLGGGRPDLFRSPGDALASAANQLRVKGWVAGLPWGMEVTIPARLDCSLEGPSQERPLSDWAALGFVRADGKAFPASMQGSVAYLMSPGGAYGPSFLVTENFKVIRRYNTSDLYATFVGNLADRIAGRAGDFVTQWRNPQQMSETGVAEIQRRLQEMGRPIDKIDGKIGSVTRAEIGAYQRRKGLRVDCWPTPALLAEMRK